MIIEKLVSQDVFKDFQSDIYNIKKNLSQEFYKDRLEALEVLKNHSSFEIIKDERFVRLDSSQANMSQVKELLETFIPWKKGPFKINDLEIDSEWRSDIKWNRLQKMLPTLKGKKILDVGCNNGYFLFKMLEHSPEWVLGIDPSLPCYLQYKAIESLIKEGHPLSFELLGHQHLHNFNNCFDIIFHMGIIYHHPNPIEQIKTLKNGLTKNGSLIIETINIPGDKSECLFPQDRYAKMRNIWFIPTTSCLVNWLHKCKFKNIEVIFDEPLTSDEQRVTEWSGNQSLENFLMPDDPKKTIEGHPSPRRVAVRADVN
jgi:tRNA (mo5U34)-methyltransferase